MFRIISLPWIFLAAVFFTACASQGPSTAEKIESLVRENRYEAAIIAYGSASPEEQETIDIGKINAEKNRFVESTLAEITTLTQQQEFARAETLLVAALERLPASEPLLKAKESFTQQKNHYLQEPSDALLLAWARFLVDEEPLLEKMKIARANEPAFIELLESRNIERKETAEKLGNLGMAQLQNKDQVTPLRYLQLANQLMPDPRWEKPITEMEQKQKRTQLSQKEKKLVDEREKKEKTEKSRQLTRNRFEASMVSGDLLAARAALEEMENLEIPADSWIQTAQERLKKTIDQSVKMAIKEGQGHYSKGEIANALRAWKAVQPLAPDHEALNESIRRAEAFQKNLNNLAEPAKK